MEKFKEVLEDLILLAESAMSQANFDGGEYDIDVELQEARALLVEMKWTKEMPSVEGWYWGRMVNVDGELSEDTDPWIIYVEKWDIRRNAWGVTEWAGPIPEPEEA